MKIIYLLLFFLSFSSLFAKKKPVIVIDPGHGGNDSGAIFIKKKQVYKEKEMALKIARLAQRQLFKDFEVYLTRTDDRYKSLMARAHIAEKVKADLFISIHINSSENSSFNGFETYYLDNKNNKALTRLEEDENKGQKWTENHHIILDIVIKKTVEHSKSLAGSIHSGIKKNIKPYGLRDRGVKPGLFYVLAFSKRPGVLLEVGFLSNEKEVKKISSLDFQKSYAKGIARGVREYFKNKK